MYSLSLLRRQLCLIAQQRRTIKYADLIKKMGIRSPLSMQKLTQGLERLMHEDTLTDAPIIAALVVQKNLPYPREGFFISAKDLGIYEGPDSGPEAELWHQNMLEQAWEFWGQDDAIQRLPLHFLAD